MNLPDLPHRASPMPGAPPPVSVQSLGSGSSGNAFLVRRGDHIVLLDCGVGIRTINGALRERGLRLDQIDAILLTHEHIDHVRTLPRVLGAGMPVIATQGTFDMITIADNQWLPIGPRRSIEVAGMSIWSLPVSHDAIEPCGFLIEMPEACITIITDLGSWHERLRGAIAVSDLVVLEANHDDDMLRRGPYPPHLKRRVASTVGHLSNHACGTAISSIAADGRSEPDVWLAHLSATNNRPRLAEDTVRDALVTSNVQLSVTALPRQEPGPIWAPPIRESRDSYRPYEEPPGAVRSTQLGFDRLGGC